MASPFPGMDPYLENPAVWPDVHFRLIAELGNQLSDRVGSRYFVAVEPRSYLVESDELILVGKPDLGVVETGAPDAESSGEGAVGVVARPRAVTVPAPLEIRERYLEVRDVVCGEAVTVLEILSPWNKRPGMGRNEYLSKRRRILGSRTSLVEIDLLRNGERPPVEPDDVEGEYRILVARGWARPRADLYGWTVRQPIPPVPVPLAEGEAEVSCELRVVLDAVYDRVGYGRLVDYGGDPVPPLSGEDADWARQLLDDGGAPGSP